MSKILIVDDEPMIRTILKSYLKDTGFELSEADNGEEALKLLKISEFDLVLSDIVMPKMNGLELTRKVTSIYGIPVIIITAFGTFDHAVDALDCGACNFVSKPFNKDQLLKIVNKALKVSRVASDNVNITSYMKQDLIFDIPSDPKLVSGIITHVETAAKYTSFSPKETSLAIILTVDELVLNAIEHGNEKDEDKRVYVQVTFKEDSFSMIVRDEGEGFDVSARPDDFDMDDIYNDRGRGILLVKHYMDSIEYNEKGNEVTVVFNRK